MKKYSLFILTAAMCCRMSGIAQPKTGSDKAGYVIPFELTAFNNISVSAVLNGRDTVHIMFHTAENSVTLTEDADMKLKTIHFNGEVDSVKSWGGQDNTSRFSEHNVLQIGGMEWPDITVWEDKNSGKTLDGKFGPNLFKNKVVEIDFDKKIITISDSLPDNIKKYEKMKLIFQKGDMYIAGNCVTSTNTYNNKFLVHSGYSGALLLDDDFVNNNKLSDQLETIGEKDLKDSYGNIVKTKKTILPEFRLGDVALRDVPAGFFEGAIGRQKKSIIGMDILKRFNIIFDAQRDYIYLKPNTLKDLGYANI